MGWSVGEHWTNTDTPFDEEWLEEDDWDEYDEDYEKADYEDRQAKKYDVYRGEPI